MTKEELSVVESFAIIGKIKGEKNKLTHQAGLTGEVALKPGSIKSISVKPAQKDLKDDQVEELT